MIKLLDILNELEIKNPNSINKEHFLNVWDYIYKQATNNLNGWDNLDNRNKCVHAINMIIRNLHNLRNEYGMSHHDYVNIPEDIDKLDQQKLFPIYSSLLKLEKIVKQHFKPVVTEIEINNPIITKEQFDKIISTDDLGEFRYPRTRDFLQKNGMRKGEPFEPYLNRISQTELNIIYKKFQKWVKENYGERLDELEINDPTIKFPIIIEDTDHWAKVAIKLERAGYKWSEGQKPTQYFPYNAVFGNKKIKIVLADKLNKVIMWGNV